MLVDAQVALAVRRDLARLARDREALLAAFAAVRDAPTTTEARRRAFELGLRFPGVASVGELASRQGDERDALLMAATDTDEARATAEALAHATLSRGVFRALHGVFAASFRSPMLDAEQRYRASLKKLATRRVWPGSPATIADVYVPPACEFFDGEQGRAFDDPLDAVRAWLARPTATEIAVIGDHGAGKSVVSIMLAVALADDPEWLPVVLSRESARSVRWELLSLLVGAGQPPPWFDLSQLPRIVLFDDRSAAVSRRPFDASVNALTVYTSSEIGWHDWGPWLALEPFNEARVRAWAARWNARVSRPFEVNQLLAQTRDDEVLSYRLVGSPFTLLMLAQMHAAGRPLRGGRRLPDRAALYREIVTWACERVSDGTAETTAAREALRSAAEESHRAALRANAPGRFAPLSLAMKGPWRRVNEAGAPFPLVVDDVGTTFFHESFAEYLLAERIALECNRLCLLAADAGSDGALAGEREDLARRWLRTFGLVAFDEALESLLRLMIPTWRSFVRGKRRTPSTFASAWRFVISTVYERLVRDDAWHLVVDVAASLDADPSPVRARAMDSLLRLGGIRDASSSSPFAPEAVVRGSIARLLKWMRTQSHVLPERSYEGAVTLANVTLEHIDLVGLDLAGIDLTSASLRGADLRGADLRRCALDGADLRGARLQGASIWGATMHGAIMIGAQIAGCDFTDVQRSAAIWTREEGLARGVPVETPDDDEIPF